MKYLSQIGGLVTVGALIAIPLLNAEEKNPSKKPEHPAPDKFEDLVKNPEYKNAQLFVQPLSPEPGTPRWEEHKKAMHLKALKRSSLDTPALETVVEALTAPPGPESGFESVDMDGKPETKDSLTIFRFTNLDSFINGDPTTPEGRKERNKALAAGIALGKAFFWDPRFSSDQKVSCASCHYSAGADQRTRGVVSFPANLQIHLPWPRQQKTKPEYEPYDLSSSDLVSGSPEIEGIYARGLFDPASLGGFQVREVIGSLGVPHQHFTGVNGDKETSEPPTPASGRRELKALLEEINRIESSNRQVTPRNAGTIINAVFNSRNFHDSRASMVFNGQTSGGEHTDDLIKKSLYVLRNSGDELEKIHTWSPKSDADDKKANPYYIANASLASQAVEPILSDVEMSYFGRMFHHIAKRMLSKSILEGQTIALNDSSLSAYSVKDKRESYEELIKTVFKKEWWNSEEKIQLPSQAVTNLKGDLSTVDEANYKDFNQMQANFGLFWGLAIQLYESTLISDQTPFDIEQRNIKRSVRAVQNLQTAQAKPDIKKLGELQPLSAAARRGFALFRTSGCTDCHVGAELTGASISETGLLKALGRADFPPAGMFDVPTDPAFADILNDDEDIVAGALLCPKEKPLGVECMDMAGRMESVYDGGNYVIGTSRFIRSPEWPIGPPVFNSDTLRKFLVPDCTALWEDNGNGNFFVPSETGIPTGGKLHTELRRLFGTCLINHSIGIQKNTVIDKLLVLLGRLNQSLADSNLDPKNPLHREGIFVVQQTLMTSPETDRGVQARKVAKELLRTSFTNQADAPALADLNAFLVEPLAKDLPPGTPTSDLNYTQNQIRLVAPRLDPATKEPQPESLAERKIFKLPNGSLLATPASPVAPHSLARRWFQRLNRIIVETEARLQLAELDDPHSPKVADLKHQLDALQRLQNNPERIADAGAFKAPSLRNVELTGPYMHNGSLLTLEAVVDFYSRGGDYNRRVKSNEEDFKSGDLHPAMEPLNLSTEQKADLVAFLKSLTDERVRNQSAPFDHPSLTIPASPIIGQEFTLDATGGDGKTWKDNKAENIEKRISFEEVLGK